MVLLNFNRTVFSAVLWHDKHTAIHHFLLWLGTFGQEYHIRSTCFRYFSSASRERFHHLQWRFRTSKRFPDGIRKAAEESVQKLSSKIDRRALVCIDAS